MSKQIETESFIVVFMMQHEKENDTCFVCNQPTLGFFKTAVEIKTNIAQVREKAKGNE